jgi:hypothetical protein
MGRPTWQWRIPDPAPYLCSWVTGDGTFGTKMDYGTGAYPASVAIGDVSGDGRPDLVVANLDSYTVSVLLGNGDGTFGAKCGLWGRG